MIPMTTTKSLAREARGRWAPTTTALTTAGSAAAAAVVLFTLIRHATCQHRQGSARDANGDQCKVVSGRDPIGTAWCLGRCAWLDWQALSLAQAKEDVVLNALLIIARTSTPRTCAMRGALQGSECVGGRARSGMGSRDGGQAGGAQERVCAPRAAAHGGRKRGQVRHAKEAFKLVSARTFTVLARRANTAPVLARSLILELIHEMPNGLDGWRLY